MNLIGYLRGLTNLPSPEMFPEKYCTEVNVLTTEESVQLVHFFNSQMPADIFRDSYNRSGLKKRHHEQTSKEGIIWYPVTFGENAQVVQERITEPYSHTINYSKCKEIIKIALEKMGQKLGFQHTTQYMGTSLAQHQLEPEEKIPKIPYHTDMATYTMVVMLDDSCQWEGGDFLFKVHDGLNPLCQNKPTQGNAVLFSNRGTQHAVQSMQLKIKAAAKRTILTLHVYGDPVEELHGRVKKGSFFTHIFSELYQLLKPYFLNISHLFFSEKERQ